MASTFILKRKFYSLEEGKFTGKRAGKYRAITTQPLLGSAVGAGIGSIFGKAGAIAGAITGGILGLIGGALDTSRYNKKPVQSITTEKIIKDLDSSMNIMNDGNIDGVDKEYKYTLNDLPENHDLTVKTNENSAVLYIRPIDAQEMKVINEILDDHCYYYKNSDYVAEQVKGGGWIVTIKIMKYEDISNLVIEFMSRLNFSVNFMTK